MKTLALDLGTHTGWAWSDGRGTVISGLWDFTTKRHQGGGMRYVFFRQNLERQLGDYGIEQAFYEEVRRHAGTSAAHVYGGFQAVLQGWCEENRIPYESVPVGRIKKFWTGKGNASKEAMIGEARRRGFEPVSDDEADALAILHLKGGLTDGPL